MKAHSSAGRQQQHDLETVTGIRAAAEHDVAEKVICEEDEGRKGHEGVAAAWTAPLISSNCCTTAAAAGVRAAKFSKAYVMPIFRR